MSDYLSQLARASGLSVGRTGGPARDARYQADAPPHAPVSAARNNNAAPPASEGPPHSEEVTFVGGPRGGGLFGGASGHASRRGRELDGEHADGVEVSPGHYARRVGGDYGPACTTPREDSTRARDAAGEAFVTFVGPNEAGRDSSPRGPRASGADSARQTGAAAGETVFVGPREGSGAREAGRHSARADSADADADGALDAEAARRAYMREIVEWISAPSPTAADEQAERARSARVEDEAESRARVSAAARESSRGLEADDVTLSIGSIHVVVEDAPAAARARPDAPAPTPSPRDSSAGGEGSRLRRHYIRL